jgi:hypothetical protein
MSTEHEDKGRPRCVAALALASLLSLVLASCSSPGPAASTSTPSSPAAISTPSASPSPSRPPLPSPAPGNGRFVGYVKDARTGNPVVDVCVIIAVGRACQENFPHTDANGFWYADLPIGGGELDWDFIFSKTGYQEERRRLRSAPGEQVVDVQLSPL